MRGSSLGTLGGGSSISGSSIGNGQGGSLGADDGLGWFTFSGGLSANTTLPGTQGAALSPVTNAAPPSGVVDGSTVRIKCPDGTVVGVGGKCPGAGAPAQGWSTTKKLVVAGGIAAAAYFLILRK
jgi:hypothetical protein